MEFIADLLIAAGAIGLAIFCFVLSRRLKALGRLDSGIGGAIAVLAAQVDDLTRALKAAQATARESANQLESQTKRADAACRKLELLMASLHDLPAPQPNRTPQAVETKTVEAAGVPGRPLARWNTNRLHGSAPPEPDTAEGTVTFVSRAKTLDPAERPTKRPRSRVVRRKHSVGARA